MSNQPIFIPELPRIPDSELPLEFSIGALGFRISRMAIMYQAQIINPEFQAAVAGPSPALAFGNLMMYLACCAGEGHIEQVVKGISAEARPPADEMEWPDEWDEWMLDTFGEGGH